MHNGFRSTQILESQMNMGSASPAQLHRRPYTPEKYSPQGGRRNFHPSAGPQQPLEYQPNWAPDGRIMWDNQSEALDTYRQMRRSSGSGSGAAGYTFGSAHGYGPPQLNGHALLQPAQEGRPVSRHLERPLDYMREFSYDGRLSQGFSKEYSTFPQLDTGPYAAQHDQPWPVGDLLQAEELQQELADAQAAEKAYLVRLVPPISTPVLHKPQKQGHVGADTFLH